MQQEYITTRKFTLIQQYLNRPTVLVFKDKLYDIFRISSFFLCKTRTYITDCIGNMFKLYIRDQRGGGAQPNCDLFIYIYI